MIVSVGKNVDDAVMASVNYSGKTYVLLWEEIKKHIGTAAEIKNVTCCVNGAKASFTVNSQDRSLVIVYDAQKGSYDYIIEGTDIVKAVCCGNRVICVAVKMNIYNMGFIFKGVSEIGSGILNYEIIGRAVCGQEYSLVPAENDAFIKIENPYNEFEYMKYVADNFSVYGMYDYWRDKDIKHCEKRPTADSFYIQFAAGSDIQDGKFVYCNDPKFAAGYLKYIILGDALYMLLISDKGKSYFLTKTNEELEKDYIPDVDYLIDKNIKFRCSCKNVLFLFEEMVRLCDAVFMADSYNEARKLVKKAFDKCRIYFEIRIFPQTGMKYCFRLYETIKEPEALICEKLTAKLKNEFRKAAEKEEWTMAEEMFMEMLFDNQL